MDFVILLKVLLLFSHIHIHLFMKE